MKHLKTIGVILLVITVPYLLGEIVNFIFNITNYFMIKCAIGMGTMFCSFLFFMVYSTIYNSFKD